MPRAWSSKDERRYEHVKGSAKERGRTDERAEEIAARTVNKERRKEGRTQAKPSRATGNPQASFEERSKRELYNLARERHVGGRSGMSKEELVRALRD